MQGSESRGGGEQSSQQGGHVGKICNEGDMNTKM